MSIASEITRIQNAKSTLKTKLNAKNDEQHQITNETIDEYGDFVDSIQSSNIIGATAEGESLSLANTKAMPYSDYVVEGKSTQEGTPSPSNPSEIHSVADDVNLFDISNIVPTTVMTPNSNGGFKIQKVGTARISDEYPIDIPANTNITISRVLKQYSSNATIYCQWKATDNTTIWTPNIYADTVTTSFNKDIKGIIFYLQQTANDGDYVEIEKLKIQKGTTTTPYSPYNQGTVTIKQRGTTENNDYTIQTEPLRSLPNGVKDTIEAEQHRKIEYLVFDGSDDEGWGSYTLLSNNIVQVGKPLSKTPKSRVGLSNRFSVVADYSSTEHIVIAGSFTAVYIHIDQTRFNTQDLAGFKEWLSNNPVTLQYELAEEVIEPLTQNQATTMLDIIKTGSYEGTTNIYTDEDVKPTIGVDYYKKG